MYFLDYRFLFLTLLVCRLSLGAAYLCLTVFGNMHRTFVPLLLPTLCTEPHYIEHISLHGLNNFTWKTSDSKEKIEHIRKIYLLIYRQHDT